jgi:glycosyltransferase involved in cell wall biosynthesis
MLTILVTGNFDPEYNRTKVIIKGFHKLGCNVLIISPFDHKSKVVAADLRQLSEKADLIFMPSFTHKQVSYVKKNTNKPVIFDPLVSRYMTKVLDYRNISKWGISAFKNKYIDRRSLNKADFVFADTEQHRAYYIEKYSVDHEKIEILQVGYVAEDFFPLDDQNNKKDFIVGYYGGFIPLHGIDKILSAAKILQDHKDIIFDLTGTGYQYKVAKRFVKKHRLSNVCFRGWSDYSGLNTIINSHDICLGIFGDTLKAEKVIPNKIFHYAACRKAIITKDTAAIKEVFSNEENILLSNSEPEAIAENILKLKQDESLRNKLAQNAFELVSAEFNEAQIARIFLEKIVKHFPHLQKKINQILAVPVQ